jgi:hypothetical protein
MKASKQIGVIVTRIREIETFLGRYYQAEGAGLHKKISHIQSQLPRSLVKRLRYIATIRNKSLHEHGFMVEDFAGYQQACQQAMAALKANSKAYQTENRFSKWMFWGIAGSLLAVTLASAVYFNEALIQFVSELWT